MIYTVDRIENGFAVCELEDGSFSDIPVSMLPKDVKEGDCVEESGGVMKINTSATEERRKKIIALQNSLWE